MAKEIKIIEMLKESKEASEIWQFIKPQLGCYVAETPHKNGVSVAKFVPSITIEDAFKIGYSLGKSQS